MTATLPRPSATREVVPTRTTGVRRRRPRRSPGRIVLHVILVAVCVAWVVPLVGLLLYSLRTATDSATNGWWRAFVRPLFTLHNFSDAWTGSGFGQALLNSAQITLPTTAITIVVCIIGGYALARMHFRGRTVLLGIAVALLVVPPQLTLVPILRVFHVLHLTGTFQAVWIYQVGFVVPFGLYLLSGFFQAFPEELLEAAYLDGASVPRAFLSVVLPTSGPIIVALAILQFMWSWNDLLIPLIFLGGGSNVAPVTVQIANLVQSNGIGLTPLSAGALMSMVIPIAVTLGLQRYFVRGLLGGAVKG